MDKKDHESEMQVASRREKMQGNGFSPRASREGRSPTDTLVCAPQPLSDFQAAAL